MAAAGLPATRSHDAEWLFFSVGCYISLSYEDVEAPAGNDEIGKTIQLPVQVSPRCSQGDKAHRRVPRRARRSSQPDRPYEMKNGCSFLVVWGQNRGELYVTKPVFMSELRLL